MTPFTGLVYFKTCDIVEVSFILVPDFYKATDTFILFIFFSSSKYSNILLILVLASTSRMTYFTFVGDSTDYFPIIMIPTLYISE